MAASIGDRSNGGMLPWREEMGDVPSSWTPYFGVEDLDAALARIPELGGRVLNGPTQMPAGSIAIVADPQGAVLALWRGDYEPDPA